MSPEVRRPAAALTCACLALTTPVVVVAAAKRSWAQPEINLVTSRRLMGGDPATFRPDAPLTRAALDDLVAGLTAATPVASGEPSAPVTLAALDQSLVRAADVRPPARFGSEVVARLLGLRTNHDARHDALELLPSAAATRAEAAFSAAQILRFRDGDTSRVESLASACWLPQYTPWQRT